MNESDKDLLRLAQIVVSRAVRRGEVALPSAKPPVLRGHAAEARVARQSRGWGNRLARQLVDLFARNERGPARVATETLTNRGTRVMPQAIHG